MAELNQTFNKGLQVIELLQLHQQLSLIELVDLTAMTKQSLLRCLETLMMRGWVRKRVNDWRYVWIGVPTSAHLKQHETWAKLSMPCIQNIALDEKMVCDLALLNEESVLTLVDSTRLRGSESVNGYVAGYQPSLVMTALGRAFLFACSPSEFNKRFSEVSHHGDLAERNFVHKERWQQEKQRIKEQGYSLRKVEDYLPELITESLPSVAIAVPIKSAKALQSKENVEPLGAINLVWQAQVYCLEEVVEKYLLTLQKTADEISRLINDEQQR